MSEEEKGYLIDIASESEYQNQTEEYHKAYTEWRMNEHNRFGYKFIKDTREHTYAYGEGFEYNEASDAERKTLRDISSLLGGVLLVSAFIRLAQAVFDSRAGHILSGAAIELSGTPRDTDRIAAVALSLFRPFSLTLCIILFQSFLRLPRKVFMPINGKASKAQVLCRLGTITGIAVICFIISVMFRVFLHTDIFSVTGGFVWTSDIALNVQYFVNQYIICAVLHAVFINGLVLQSLRQFGDSTAVFFSTIVEGVMAISFTKISTHLVMGVCFALLTIKTGSIIAPIVARILTNCIFFSLRLIDYYYPGEAGELFLVLTCVVIMAIAMFCIGQLLNMGGLDVSLKSSDEGLSFREKSRVFFTSMPMIEWCAAAVVAWLFILVA